MFRAVVRVTLRRGVLDPQGETVKGALKTLGYGEVAEVRVGKHMELAVDGPDPGTVRSRVEEMCRRLLANPVLEDYAVEVEELG